jgi:hypothetical protein
MITRMRTLASMVSALVMVGAMAQNDAIFHSVGWTVYLDYMQGPPTSFLIPATPSSPSRTEYAQEAGVSIFTMLYNFRYNVKELSEDAAISISATPALGVYSSISGNESGIGHFNLPITLGWEYGAGSTYNSAKSTGTFVRAGWEFTRAPLAALTSNAEVESKKSWGALSLQSGIRYYNKKNRMRELNVKYARGASGVGENSQGVVVDRRAWGIRLAWVFILNY